MYSLISRLMQGQFLSAHDVVRIAVRKNIFFLYDFNIDMYFYDLEIAVCTLGTL